MKATLVMATYKTAITMLGQSLLRLNWETECPRVQNSTVIPLLPKIPPP